MESPEDVDPLADAVAAIVAHVNEDHAADVLLICRHLGGATTATGARMVTVDVAAATFVATVDGRAVPVRIGWRAPITARAQVRSEMVALVERARAVSAGTGS